MPAHPGFPMYGFEESKRQTGSARCENQSVDYLAFPQLVAKPSYCGWTKSCTTLKPWFLGISRGIIRNQGFLGGARSGFRNHSMYLFGFPSPREAPHPCRLHQGLQLPTVACLNAGICGPLFLLASVDRRLGAFLLYIYIVLIYIYIYEYLFFSFYPVLVGPFFFRQGRVFRRRKGRGVVFRGVGVVCVLKGYWPIFGAG